MMRLLKTNAILICINRRILSRSRKVTVPLYSELVRQHLEYCVQGWARHFQRDIDKRVSRMVRGLKTISYKECLRELATLSMENS